MIVTLNPEIAGRITANLRDRDRREVECVLPAGRDLVTWAASLFDAPAADQWAAIDAEGVPVAMGGVSPVPGFEHLANSWAVGTDRKLLAGVEIFRQALRLHTEWQRRGVRRFQCTCLDTPEESSAWLERLGYQREGVLRGLGKNGEDFIMWGMYHGC